MRKQIPIVVVVMAALMPLVAQAKTIYPGSQCKLLDPWGNEAQGTMTGAVLTNTTGQPMLVNCPIGNSTYSPASSYYGVVTTGDNCAICESNAPTYTNCWNMTLNACSSDSPNWCWYASGSWPYSGIELHCWLPNGGVMSNYWVQ